MTRRVRSLAPSYAVGDVSIYVGDAVDVLRRLPAGSAHCVVTSPPYWGLRDYGTAVWAGGNNPECDHAQQRRERDLGSKSATSVGSTRDSLAGRTKCRKCGARRVDKQIGLESTPEAYVARLVEVFREVQRVLRDDGTVWLNLGDSYNAAGREGHGTRVGYKQGTNRASAADADQHRPSAVGLKPKDLVGIPWRVAFALQADGWYLRQDIIWFKRNPMPESVRDRCTKAHEYLFLLSKSERYYYDADAIAEASAYPGDNRALRPDTRKAIDPMCMDGGSRARTGTPTGETRNRRSVWEVTTAPYFGAHFATFPPALVEPCILAGCPAGGVMLDPFGGAGTVGLVAQRHRRGAVLIDLNPEYAKMAYQRIADEPVLEDFLAPRRLVYTQTDLL